MITDQQLRWTIEHGSDTMIERVMSANGRQLIMWANGVLKHRKMFCNESVRLRLIESDECDSYPPRILAMARDITTAALLDAGKASFQLSGAAFYDVISVWHASDAAKMLKRMLEEHEKTDEKIRVMSEGTMNGTDEILTELFKPYPVNAGDKQYRGRDSKPVPFSSAHNASFFKPLTGYQTKLYCFALDCLRSVYEQCAAVDGKKHVDVKQMVFDEIKRRRL